ncbi:helix-turn-helix domain-containing protein [Amycolatopsis sp. CA-230715]|uniref:helix-turn-helix domain-containing protein n=1 Tax=Amycolatopsis sp. CA-230715 TaxID=2745196 RepID=UPI001C012904|nr:helix-turn-helix transcriptional regulator [Amycolatopsis sp. CA-230715]QWF81067.1 hypothetical protein HUW46_04492 [Amycolatopsis sp. CA-230715]
MTTAEDGRLHPLAVVLRERGMTLDKLASSYRGELARQGLRSGADRQLIWKWKSGKKTPSIESQHVLATVLGVPHTLVTERGWPFWVWCATNTHGRLVEPPWSITGTMKVLRWVTGDRVDRRGFLALSGASLLGIATEWASSMATAKATTLVAPEARGECLSREVLGRLGSRLAELRHLDDVFGGTDLRHLARAELRWLSTLADTATYDETTGRALFAHITEAARLCGWLHFDVAQHAAAQEHYVTALRSSVEANAPEAGAHVLACMSFQVMLDGHPNDALSLLDTASGFLGRSGNARLRAMIASRKARAHAIDGDARGCGHQLNLAERYLDAADADLDDSPDWIYYFDHAELDAQAGASWVSLSQPARARPLIDSALSAMSSDYVRDLTIYHTRSAQAYADVDELDMACRDFTTAIDLVTQTQSVRSIETIRAGRVSLDRYKDDPRVKKLDRQLQRIAC